MDNRNNELLRMDWNRIFEIKQETNLTGLKRIQKPVKLPVELWKWILNDLRLFEDVGRKVSYNEIVIYALISLFNLEQTEDRNFSRLPNGQTVEDYLKSLDIEDLKQ